MFLLNKTWLSTTVLFSLVVVSFGCSPWGNLAYLKTAEEWNNALESLLKGEEEYHDKVLFTRNDLMVRFKESDEPPKSLHEFGNHLAFAVGHDAMDRILQFAKDHLKEYPNDERLRREKFATKVNQMTGTYPEKPDQKKNHYMTVFSKTKHSDIAFQPFLATRPNHVAHLKSFSDCKYDDEGKEVCQEKPLSVRFDPQVMSYLTSTSYGQVTGSHPYRYRELKMYRRYRNRFLEIRRKFGTNGLARYYNGKTITDPQEARAFEEVHSSFSDLYRGDGFTFDRKSDEYLVRGDLPLKELAASTLAVLLASS